MTERYKIYVNCPHCNATHQVSMKTKVYVCEDCDRFYRVRFGVVYKIVSTEIINSLEMLWDVMARLKTGSDRILEEDDE